MQKIILFLSVAVVGILSFHTNGQFQQINNFLSYNDYINNPAEMFYDKGANVFLNHRAFYGYRNLSSSGYTLPSLSAAGFKNVFQKRLGSKKTLEQQWFPGFGVVGSYVNGGGAFSEFNLHLQAGVRYSLDKNNSMRNDTDNSFIALAGGVVLGNVFTRSLAEGNDFYLTHTGDQILENFNASYGVSRFMKFGFTLRKHLTNSYQYFGLDMSTGIPFLVEKNSLNYATNYYFQINPEYQWGESSLISCAFRTLDASKSLQLVPYAEVEIFNKRNGWFYNDYNFSAREHEEDYQGDFNSGSRKRGAFSIGIGSVINVKSNIEYSNIFNQFFINLRYNFFHYDRKSASSPFKSSYGDVDFGTGYSPSSLSAIGLPVNLNASYSYKNSPNECKIEFNSIDKKGQFDENDLNAAKEVMKEIDDLRGYPCFSNLNSDQKRRVDEIYKRAMAVKRKKEDYEKDKIMYPTKIGSDTWVKNNSSLKVDNEGRDINFAGDINSWIDFCDKDQPAFCYYQFNSENSYMGCVYNYAAIKVLAPEGYKVPSKKDYETLLSELKKTKKTNTLCSIIKPGTCNICIGCGANDYNSQIDFNLSPYGWLSVTKSNKYKWKEKGEDMYFWTLEAERKNMALSGMGMAQFKIPSTIKTVELNEINNVGAKGENVKNKDDFNFIEKYYGTFVRFVKK